MTFTMVGTDGAAGNMAGSGARCRRDPGDSSTLNDADQEVSPLSDDAVHVYRPESDTSSSAKQLNNLLRKIKRMIETVIGKSKNISEQYCIVVLNSKKQDS